MADLPAHPKRSNGLRPAIWIGLGLAAVLVVFGLGLWGPPEVDPAKPLQTARTSDQAGIPSPVRIAPSFDVVRVNPAGDTVIAGRAAPGAEVVIRQAGREIGRARADDRGEWVFLPTQPLESGAQELTLGALMADGSEIAGAGSVLLVVPERLASGAAPGTAVAVLSDAAGAPRVLQNGTGKARGVLGLDAVEYDDQGQLRFAGSAPPGARVRVQIDDRVAGEAVADSGGVWTLIPSSPVTPGAHRLRLDRLGPDGQVAERAEYPFQRDSLTAKERAEGSIVVRPGNNLWLLARGRYGEGARYTVIYAANRAKLKDPAKIYPGQVLALPPADAARPNLAPNLAGKR